MKSYRFFSALAVAGGILLGLVLMLSGTGGSASAQPGVTPTPATVIPANEPERGLIYDGLARDSACGRGFRIPGTNRCTHGPDSAPFNLNVVESVPPESAPVSLSDSFQCDGNGTTGYRIQVLYVRASDRADRYNQYVGSFRTWLAEMDLIYQHSAAETGGVRRVRFVHGGDCVPTIGSVTVPTTGDDSFGSTIEALQALGYDRTDRKYLIFMDANLYCGIGTLWLDDSAGQSNANNSGPDWGRTDSGCWGASVPAHELNHNLGGVQDSAPNSTAHQDSGGHCSDEYDRMCYVDANGVQMYSLCPDFEHDRLLDCNHDDYFHTNPPVGNYLATHWNTASSRFLGAPQPTCLPTLNVTSYLSETAETRVTVAWTIAGTGCSIVRHADIHWDTLPRDGEHPSQYRYSNYGGQEQSGGLGDYQATFYLEDDIDGIPSNVYFVVHAFLDDAAEVVSPEYVVAFSNASPTATPTVTVSPTPTVTPTSCATAPAKPTLLVPAKNTVLAAGKAFLDWADSACAQSYQVEVRKGAKTGDVVKSKTNLAASHIAVKKLEDNTTYFWRIRSCNAITCVASGWRKFRIDLP